MLMQDFKHFNNPLLTYEYIRSLTAPDYKGGRIERGGVVLVLRPKEFIQPVIRVGSKVIPYKNERDVYQLRNTPALVSGYSHSNGNNDNKKDDVELLCVDRVFRSLDAMKGEGRDFVFIPHPSFLHEFIGTLQFQPGLLRLLGCHNDFFSGKDRERVYARHLQRAHLGLLGYFSRLS